MSRKKRAVREALEKMRPFDPVITICSMCGESHVGDSEESLASLAVLDPEAAVYYGRDVVGAINVVGRCGPRFRQNSSGLFAHYGAPAGRFYVVYQWKLDEKRWEAIIDVQLDRDRRIVAGGAP